jgi:toxoflavin biosynthesis protein ToxD
MKSAHFREEAGLATIDECLLRHIPASSDPELLARITQDPHAPLGARLSAGSILAVIGDPRFAHDPELILVPGGRVQIGLPPDRITEVTAAWQHVGVEAAWIRKEAPAHMVGLGDFLIGAYPVTNQQYKRFLTATGYPRRPSTWYLGAYPWDRANHPVAGLQAEDADAYVAWLEDHASMPVRLPTEAEWEYAAKGPAGLEYPWGEQFDPGLANTRESGIHTTTPVGIYPAGRSPFGLWDMAGNVEEYVADCYSPYPGGEPVDDHLVAALGTYRVTRGGSFARYGDLARTRRRHGSFPGPLYPCGLRVACDASTEARATGTIRDGQVRRNP